MTESKVKRLRAAAGAGSSMADATLDASSSSQSLEYRDAHLLTPSSSSATLDAAQDGRSGSKHILLIELLRDEWWRAAAVGGMQGWGETGVRLSLIQSRLRHCGIFFSGRRSGQGGGLLGRVEVERQRRKLPV